MDSIRHYASPLGPILLAASDLGLTGLWFEGQAHYARTLTHPCREQDSPFLKDAAAWLDLYFSGREPDFLPPLDLTGTPFQRAVWEALLTIPYGGTRTYGQLAASLGCRSAQAVGHAVSRNPISILVPCHRVLGASGDLTGYAGGLSRKAFLLALEQRK